MKLPQVRLVAKTTPTIDEIDSEDFVAYVARVSNPGNQLNTETAPKLLKYLVKNKHWSPFEMVHLVMEITTTRDISHQIIRHRSFAFQEFSQRYAAVDESGFTYREARLQDLKNRQNSIQTDNENLVCTWTKVQEEILNTSRAAYKWALNNGIAKEQARAILPEGMTVTKLYMSGSLRSWIHYCELRGANGTQKEHMEIAIKARKIIEKEFPSLTGLLNNDN